MNKEQLIEKLKAATDRTRRQLNTVERQLGYKRPVHSEAALQAALVTLAAAQAKLMAAERFLKVPP